MDFDFELVLTGLVALFGVGYAIDVWLWKPGRVAALAAATSSAGAQLPMEDQAKLLKENLFAEYSRSFFPVLAFVLVLRSFFMEPYQIPSGSMLPTLTVGDFIVVNKFEYGVRLPVLGTKILDNNQPQVGDVMVFKYPVDPAVKFIKRVVGVPGDKLQYRDKVLTVNGVVLSQTYVDDASPSTELYAEVIDGVEHQIWRNKNAGRNWSVTVPAGNYFMMGDNRDGSNDSRYWGFVPEENITGKAIAVWLHWENFLSLPNFSTVGGIE
ncbi:MAG TPA: signal peptidase I [Oceanospirillaceae bacterium]|nr:signal peptidase I [Oceanospirillaceae bacterium]